MRRGTRIRVTSEVHGLAGRAGVVILGAVCPTDTITIEVDGRRYAVTGRDVERLPKGKAGRV